MTTVNIPPRSELNDLIGAAFKIQATSNMPDLTTIQVVNALLDSANVSLVNQSVSHVLGPHVDGLRVLKALALVLPLLPTDSFGMDLLIGHIVMVTAALFFVALRFYVRKFVKPKRIGVEDWTCLFAFVTFVGEIVVLSLGNLRGYHSNHIYTLTLNQASLCGKYVLFNIVTYIIASWASKINFVVFYYQVLPDISFRRWLWALGIFLNVIAIVSIFMEIFRTRPIDYWNHFATAKGLSQFYITLASSSAAVLADVILIVMSLRMVLGLKLRMMDKLVVAGMFGAGFFITAVFIYRMVETKVWLGNHDWSYSAKIMHIVSPLEVCLSIIISCFPSLRSLVYRRDNHVSRVPELSFSRDGMFRPRLARQVQVLKGRQTRSLRNAITTRIGIWSTVDTKPHEESTDLGLIERSLSGPSDAAVSLSMRMDLDLEKSVSAEKGEY